MSHLLRSDQLGPNLRPIVGTQVFAGRGAIRDGLNFHAIPHWGASHFPVADGRCCHAKFLGEGSTATYRKGSGINRMGFA